MTVALKAVSADKQQPVHPARFEDLYRDNRDDVYGYVAGLLRDRIAAEDVTALAFERAYRKWDRFNPSRGTARGWIFGIARNAALDELRKRKRQAPLTSDPPDTGPSVEASHEQLEREAAVNAAMTSLPAADRELISLKFFADLDNTEIATATGISPSNVGTRLHRASTKLRSAVTEEVPR